MPKVILPFKRLRQLSALSPAYGLNKLKSTASLHKPKSTIRVGLAFGNIIILEQKLEVLL